MTQSDVHVKVEEVHPQPERAHEMPSAPAIEVVGASQILFLSGATPGGHGDAGDTAETEHVLPDDNNLSSPGARIELDMIAVGGVS